MTVKVPKSERVKNLSEVAKNLQLVRDGGCTVELLDAGSHHYRVVGPQGGRANLYGSTLSWNMIGQPQHGYGIERLLKAMAKAKAPKKAKTAHVVTPARGPIAVTIITDAAFSHKNQAGAWGAWIKYGPDAPITAGGAMKDAVENSVLAEAMAMANAMAIAKARGLLVEGAGVMLQTDCLPVLQKIRTYCPTVMDSPAGEGRPVFPHRTRSGLHGKGEVRVIPAPIKIICDMILETKIRAVTRHVPGHRAGDGRAWVNRFCDATAKAHLKQRLADMKATQSHAA